VARRAAELREAILREGPETVSAVILEPVVSSGGFIIPPIGWLRAVRRLCNELDVLMIADEVITGFGRTGRWFACEHDGVVPDLLTVAKGITSGYVPLSASIAGRRLADAFPEDAVQENVHPNTYAAHPVACAAALANLTIMEKGLVDNAQAMGARLLDGLRAALAGSPIVGEVRGRGLMVCGVRRAGRLRPAARPGARGRAGPPGLGARRHRLRARQRGSPGAAALHHGGRGRSARRHHGRQHPRAGEDLRGLRELAEGLRPPVEAAHLLRQGSRSHVPAPDGGFGARPAEPSAGDPGHRPAELLGIRRLLQLLDEAGRQRPRPRMLAAVRGGGHDGQRPQPLVGKTPDLLKEPVAVLAGNGDVAQDHVGPPGREQGERLARARRRDDARPVGGMLQSRDIVRGLTMGASKG
jgi:hypothetical protein